MSTRLLQGPARNRQDISEIGMTKYRASLRAQRLLLTFSLSRAGLDISFLCAGTSTLFTLLVNRPYTIFLSSQIIVKSLREGRLIQRRLAFWHSRRRNARVASKGAVREAGQVPAPVRSDVARPPTRLRGAIAVPPLLQLSFSNRENTQQRERLITPRGRLAYRSPPSPSPRHVLHSHIRTRIAYSLSPTLTHVRRGLNAEVAPPRVDIAQVDLHGQLATRVVHLG